MTTTLRPPAPAAAAQPGLTQRLGLTLSVYRDGRQDTPDCSGGFSARHHRCVLVGVVRHVGDETRIEYLRRDCRVTPPTEQAPAVWLIADRHGPGDRFIVPAAPEGGPDLDTCLMFGGNLAHSTDGRWMALSGNQYGVRIHDRSEGRTLRLAEVGPR